MRFDRFEDIRAWQLSRELTKAVYEITDRPPAAQDYRFRSQITAAAVSIMSNIAEGFERGGNPEFIQFLWIAKGSAGEVRSLLYVAMDRQYITTDVFNELYAQTVEIGRMIMGLIRYLEQSPIKGRRYK